MKKSLLIIALCVFISISATAIAGNDKTNVSPIGSLNFSDRVVYVLDHSSNPNEGNWITLGKYSDLRRIQLPSPMSLTYNGPKHIEYGGASGTLYIGENESYMVRYPSSLSYSTLPVYLPGENVKMTFHGEKGLEGDVDIYLLNLTSDSVTGVLDAIIAGNIGNLNDLFYDNFGGNYTIFNATIGKNGDLLNYDLGTPDAGEYCIVMIQENEDSSLTVFSATAFTVTEYELEISTTGYKGSIDKGKNLDISMDLKNASDKDKDDCTYGAVLINEVAYKANAVINSDGTKNGSHLIVNDVDVFDEFDINGSNYKSKLTDKTELQNIVQTLIGEGNGTVSIGDAGDNTLSLTTLDLTAGKYYVFVGAYIPEKGLVGLNQIETRIIHSGKCCANCDNCHGNCCEFCSNCTHCHIPDDRCCANCDNCHGNCCNDCPNCPYCDYNGDKCCGNCDGCHDGKCCDDCDDCDNCHSDPDDLIVDFIASPMSGKVPLCVQFTDKSTGSPTAWYWDFGDGTNSTAQNPEHIFTVAGTYTVKLTASYGNVISKTATVTIIATDPSPNNLAADFIASPVSGKAPLCVQFTDKSTGSPTAWYWNFGDGTSSTAQSPAHTFTAAGTYTVKLTASNENGTSPTPKTATITVTKEGGDGGSSGSGGSSGGSISPESSKNIKCKELCQQYISSGKFVKFEFKKGDTCINYVAFNAKKTAGKTTAIVEELIGRSSLTPEKPEGEIYKYVNIWIGNSGFANSNNIENATVGFKVSKDWIDENNINIDSLVLQHFNDKKWNQLPTKKINEDKEYIYFEAEATSFSPFAISAEKNKVTIEGKDGENDVCSGDVAQDEPKSTSDTTSQENKNQTILKITTFLAGLIVILIVGAIIMRKKKPEQ